METGQINFISFDEYKERLVNYKPKKELTNDEILSDVEIIIKDFNDK